MPATPEQSRPFLRARWLSLAFINYEVSPALLAALVPAGTELDAWEGKVLVSAVGFRFERTQIMGLSVPLHQNFSEVNLRFYVRHQGPQGWRRGVVFIKEIVPRPAIAAIARAFYNERYVSLPMRHAVAANEARYEWRLNAWNALWVKTAGTFEPLWAGSQEEFVTEHFWGYARQHDGSTMEYNVQHPSWRVARATEFGFECDAERLYGALFKTVFDEPVVSAFFADGSAVRVFPGTVIAR